MKILFIGNSFTFYNAMPGLLKRIAYGEGERLEVDSITFGGYYIGRYSDTSTEDGKYTDEVLNSNNWDYVVLQGQSLEPAVNKESFLKTVKELCDKIYSIGAKPILYQSWSYYEGSEKLISTGLSYEQMYLALKDAYITAAEQNSAVLVPVGDIFYKNNEPYGKMRFICGDDYHPTHIGSYAAAVCFYRTLFEVKEGEHWHHPDIKKERANLVWELTKDIKCKV